MKNKASVWFSWFFIICIISVPCIQIIYEISSKSRIQFFDIFTDMLITPSQYVNIVSHLGNESLTMLNQLNTLTTTIDTASFDNSSNVISSRIEDVLTKTEDLRRALITINRCTMDSSSEAVHQADSIIFLLKMLNMNDYTNLPSQIEIIKDKAIFLNGTLPHNIIITTLVHIFKHSIFNGKYIRAYEKELESTSIVANTIRPPVLFTRYVLLKDLGEKAISGKNEWLFYKPDVQYLYDPPVVKYDLKREKINGSQSDNNPLTTIINFKKQLEKLGIELVVVIVPGKPSIYPDLINPQAIAQKDLEKLQSVKMIEILRNNSINVVDLFHPFINERRNDTICGDSLYLKTDTHWKTRAPRLAATIVANEVKKKSWYVDNHNTIEYTIDSVDVIRKGDIGQMTKLPDFKIGLLQIDFPVEKTKCYQIFKVFRTENGEISERQLYKDDNRNSRILILGDSFSRIYQTDEPRSAGWISHLAYELSEPMSSIVSDGGASTIVRQTLAKKTSLLKNKKLVIWEFVERDFRFGAEGWKDIQIVQQ